MGKKIRPFCWHQNCVPWGPSAPARGYIHVLNREKKMYTIRLQRHFFKLATNERIDKTFLLTLKLCPLRAVCPSPGAIYMYKIMKKKCIKAEFKRDLFLNLQQMIKCDKMLTLKFRPQGVVSPCPGSIYMYKILKKNCIKSDFKEIFFNL